VKIQMSNNGKKPDVAQLPPRVGQETPEHARGIRNGGFDKQREKQLSSAGPNSRLLPDGAGRTRLAMAGTLEQRNR